MRKLVAGILIFGAGWGLSWFTYQYPAENPSRPARAVSTLPSKPLDPVPLSTAPIAPEYAPVDDISSLLQGNDFEAAVTYYESMQFLPNDLDAAAARDKILAHASQLLDESRFGLAEQLLQRFLLAAFRDVEAHMLLANVYLGERSFNTALAQLYEARGHAYRPFMLQRVNNRIRSTVTERAALLQADNDQNALLALYQQLTQFEPDHAPWFIELAAAQFALADTDAARRSLQLVLQDPDVGTRAQVMLAQLTRVGPETGNARPPVAAAEVVGIALQRQGDHFIVAASPPGNRTIRLLIDTGASLTMLNSDVFTRQGIPYTDTGRSGIFNTANGPVRAPIYRLESLAVGDWQVTRLEVGVLSGLGDANIDGLLGMNFLRHFQFFIDQNEALLRLAAN